MRVSVQELHRRLTTKVAEQQLSGISRAVRDAHLTYLVPPRLRTLEKAVRQIERQQVAGDVLECGIALGGSAIVLATLMGPGRAFHGYDVFGMIPAPGERDDAHSHERYAVIAAGESKGIDGETYYGYDDDLLARVTASFAEHGVPVDGERVQLHRGLFEDTLHPEGPVALVHIDSDWFDPVKTCLERVYPQLSPGGLIVLDDYDDYGGCRDAVTEFLAEVDDVRLVATPSNAVLARSPAAVPAGG